MEETKSLGRSREPPADSLSGHNTQQANFREGGMGELKSGSPAMGIVKLLRVSELGFHL
jgi:hypothetical protein